MFASGPLTESPPGRGRSHRSVTAPRRREEKRRDGTRPEPPGPKGGVALGWHAPQIRSPANSAGAGGEADREEGWATRATRSEVSRGASREGRRGSRLAARVESARPATCGCSAASGGGIWARRRVIGRFVVQRASVMLPRAGGPGATSGSGRWAGSRVSSGFAYSCCLGN